MSRGVMWSVAGVLVLGVLAGCGRSSFFGQREAWRHEAEVECLKSGAVKDSPAHVRIEPISGPGMCGADFPLKVEALGGDAPVYGFADELRPPGSIPNGSQPRWPIAEPRYGAQASPAYQPRPVAVDRAPMPDVYQPRGAPRVDIPSSNAPMSLSPRGYEASAQAPRGSAMTATAPPESLRPRSLDEQAIDLSVNRVRQSQPSFGAPPPQPSYVPPESYVPPKSYGLPKSQPSFGARSPAPPMPPAPQADEEADDIPDDAILPKDRRPPPRRNAPMARPAPIATPVPLKRNAEFTGAIGPVEVKPAATLACPIVSALDQWIASAVQPAAKRWLGQPVVEIKQISAYSCRGMNGQPGAHISEHAFGNALDIAAFTLADGRKITVKDGWHGLPEEQGFLRDVQGAACQQFSTVLAPGSNRFHYDHIHVDLMRRASGRTACNPSPVPGEVAAARAAGKYARKGDPSFTGSVGGKKSKPGLFKSFFRPTAEEYSDEDAAEDADEH